MRSDSDDIGRLRVEGVAGVSGCYDHRCEDHCEQKIPNHSWPLSLSFAGVISLPHTSHREVLRLAKSSMNGP